MGLHQAVTRREEVAAIVGEDVACLNGGCPEGRRRRLIGDHV